MFPSVDSFTLEQIEARQALMTTIGWWAVLLGTLLGLAITLWWQGYGDRLTEKKTALEAARKQLEDAEKETKAALAMKTAEDARLAASKIDQLVASHTLLRTGLLTPDNQPAPNITAGLPGMSLESSPRDIRLYLGDSFATSDRFPCTFIRQGNENLIFVEQQGEVGIVFSAKIYNESGEAVCWFDKNKFWNNTDDLMRVEKTDHRLTLWNKKTELVLDVEYLNPTTIRLTGNFYLQNGFRVQIDEEKQNFGGRIISNSAFGFLSIDNPAAVWVDRPKDAPGISFFDFSSSGPGQEVATTQQPTFSGNLIQITGRQLPSDAPDGPRLEHTMIGNDFEPNQNNITTLMLYNSGKKDGVVRGRCIGRFFGATSGDGDEEARSYFKNVQAAELSETDFTVKSNTNFNCEFEAAPLDASSMKALRERSITVFCGGRLRYTDENGGNSRGLLFCYKWDEGAKQWKQFGGEELNNVGIPAKSK